MGLNSILEVDGFFGIDGSLISTSRAGGHYAGIARLTCCVIGVRRSVLVSGKKKAPHLRHPSVGNLSIIAR